MFQLHPLDDLLSEVSKKTIRDEVYMNGKDNRFK